MLIRSGLSRHISMASPRLPLAELGLRSGLPPEEQFIYYIRFTLRRSSSWSQPKWTFGINGNQNNSEVQSLGAAAQLLKATETTKTPGKAKMADIVENVSPGITANDSVAAALKYSGLKIVYKEAPIAVLGTTNYAPYAQAIIASGANLTFEMLDSTDAIGLAVALKAAGFKGTIVNGVTVSPGQLASQPSEAAGAERRVRRE